MRAAAQTALARITLLGLAARASCSPAMLLGEVSEFHSPSASANQAYRLTSIKI